MVIHDLKHPIESAIGQLGLLEKNVKELREKIKQKRSFELMDRLHLDMWLQDKYLLNGVDIRLRLNRSSAAFHLMAHANDYKTIIKEARLYVRRVEVLSIKRETISVKP
jgi:hypothetical protein